MNGPNNAALTKAVRAALVRYIPQERNRRQAEERARLADQAKGGAEEATRYRLSQPRCSLADGQNEAAASGVGQIPRRSVAMID